MTEERASARESNDASVIRGSGLGEQAAAHGRYEVECIGPDGKLKWRDTIENVVADVARTWRWIRSLPGRPIPSPGRSWG